MRTHPRTHRALLIVAAASASLAGPGCARTPSVPPVQTVPNAPAIRQAPTRSDPAAPGVPVLEAGTEGHIVIGPYVQPGGTDLSTSMRIVWWSDAPGPGALEWTTPDGDVGGRMLSVQLPFHGMVRHAARIPRPRGATAVRVLPAVTVNGRRFTTKVTTVPFAPGPGEPLRFGAVGDTGAGTDAQRSLVRQMEKHDLDLLLLTGDDVYNTGDWDEYRRRFFPYYGGLMATVPILPALGNHDVGNPKHMGQPFRMAWTPPLNFAPPPGSGRYSLFRARSMRSEGPVPPGQESGRNYSVDAGACHFLCLDSTADRETIERQIIPWARQDLEDAKRRGQTWLIVFWHHPPYTRGAYRDNRTQWGDIRDLYVPMLREAGAHVVLLGHDHNYQNIEKDGIRYIVTGAGGARLYPVHPDDDGNGQPPLIAYNDKVYSFTVFDQSADGRTLKVRQVAADGREIDAFTLTAR